MRVATIGFLLAVSATHCAAAANNTVSVQPEVQSLLDDIEAGRRDAAVERISGIFSITGEPRLITSRGDFVDKLLNCKKTNVVQSGSRTLIWYNVRWDCKGVVFESGIGKDPNSSYVEVIDFADEARLAERASASKNDIALAPRMIDESTEEMAARAEREKADRTAILSELERAFLQNSLEPVASRIDPETNFRLGYRDMAAKVFVSDMDGNGKGAGEAQMAWLLTNLGKANSASCTPRPLNEKFADVVLTTCSVKTERPAHGYSVMFHIKGSQLAWLEFSYMNETFIKKNIEYLRANGIVK